MSASSTTSTRAPANCRSGSFMVWPSRATQDVLERCWPASSDAATRASPYQALPETTRADHSFRPSMGRLDSIDYPATGWVLSIAGRRRDASFRLAQARFRALLPARASNRRACAIASSTRSARPSDFRQRSRSPAAASSARAPRPAATPLSVCASRAAVARSPACSACCDLVQRAGLLHHELAQQPGVEAHADAGAGQRRVDLQTRHGAQRRQQGEAPAPAAASARSAPRLRRRETAGAA